MKPVARRLPQSLDRGSEAEHGNGDGRLLIGPRPATSRREELEEEVLALRAQLLEHEDTVERLKRRIAARDFEIERRDYEIDALEERMDLLLALLGDAQTETKRMLQRVAHAFHPETGPTD